MQILLTGGTGFIGSHITRAAVAGGHRVRLLARTPAKVPEVLGPLGVDGDAVEVFTGDATDATAVREAIAGCDAVIHAAAVVSMRRSESAASHIANLTAARCVLGSAAAAGCDPIVHVSSISVLERGATVTGLDAPVRTSTEGYSRAKADIEWYARGMQDAGVPVVITYPNGVLGPVSPTLTALHRAAQTWISTMMLPPSGIGIVDVRDLAAQHVAMLEPGLGPRRFLHGGNFATWRDLGAMIESATDRTIPKLRTPGAMLRGAGRVVDLTHLPNPLDFDLTLEAMTEATRAVPVDSTATVDALGIPFRPTQESLADTYRWMFETGAVTAKQAGALASDRAGDYADAG